MPINRSTISNLSGRVAAALDAGRLGEALSSLQSFALAVSAPYAVVSRIASLSESYAMLSRYLIDGLADPQRTDIAADIAAEASVICATLVRDALTESGEPTLYFSTLRFESTRQEESISHLLHSWPREDDATPPATTESLATRIFNKIWTTYPLSSTDSEAIHAAVASGTLALPAHIRVLLIGSLLLGGLQYFESRRAILLADIYRVNHDSPLGAIALTALLLLLAYSPTYSTGSRKLAAALGSLESVDTLAADARMAFMQLVRSRDTERVRRKLTDDLLPGIMNLRPDIDRRMRDLDSSASGLFDEEGDLNPEWEEMFEKSGLGDKLREFSELQSEGADVMMATMGNLKDFAFFNDPANWFLPFHPSHSSASAPGIAPLAKSLAGLPMMCDSDKYSFILLAGRMGPRMASPSLSAHLEEQRRQWAEMMKTDLGAGSRDKSDAANSFVQNVYRFFKLFRRKGEFADPFLHPINPLTTPLLSDIFAADAGALAVPAEFYFRRGHYEEALQLFGRIEELTPPSADLYQKKGYALELLGRLDEALGAYNTADLIDSESVWTLRRIASVLRRLGRPSEALPFYTRIKALKPDRRADIMDEAAALMALNRFKDALALLYKADYLKPDRISTLRPMVTCQLVIGDYQKAVATTQRIGALPDLALTADDHILSGHACLAIGHYRDAISSYASAIAALDHDAARFISRMDTDSRLIERIGADRLTTSIIIEAAIESAAQQRLSDNR